MALLCVGLFTLFLAIQAFDPEHPGHNHEQPIVLPVGINLKQADLKDHNDDKESLSHTTALPLMTTTDISAFFCQFLDDGLHTYPGDCTKFVECYGGYQDVGECPIGQLFFEELQKCDVYANVPEDLLQECGVLTTTSETPVPSVTSTTFTPTPTTQWQDACPDIPDGTYTYGGDCRFYIYCFFDIGEVRMCPEDKYYNPETRACNYPHELDPYRLAECGLTTTPWTWSTFPTSTPEPDSCYGMPDGFYVYPGRCDYYIRCLNDQGDVYLCPEPGTYFSPFYQQCLPPAQLEPGRYEECFGTPTPTAPPTPTCFGQPDGVYSYPGDCTKYYNCIGGDYYEYGCSEDTYYNPIYEQCTDFGLLDPDRQEECLGGTTVTGTPTTTTTDLPPASCEDRPDGIFAYPGDCTLYYQCINENFYLYECPEGQYYNPAPEYEQCTSEALLDPDRYDECLGSTPPPTFCTGLPNGNHEYPVSDVCDRYIQCLNGEATLLYCPPGDFFNPNVGYCTNPESLDDGKYEECFGEPPPFSTPSPFYCIGKPDGVYKYPGDCGQYIQCLDESMTVYGCPSNTYFNPETNGCTSWEELLPDRYFECFGTTPPTTILPPTFCTGKPNGPYSYPDQCGRYIYCSNNEYFDQFCPIDTYYNPITEDCTYWWFLSDERYEECFDEPKPTTSTGQPITTTPAPVSCFNQPDGTTLKDPTDCQKYYECIDGQAVSHDCLEPGTYYNPVNGLCDWAYNLEDDRITECELDYFDCPPEDGSYTHPLDCTKYFSCSFGTPWPMDCPANLYWDPDVGICNYDYNLSDERKAECGLSFSCPEPPFDTGTYTHPTDCEKYIECINGMAFFIDCPGGLYYSPSYVDCVNINLLDQNRLAEC